MNKNRFFLPALLAATFPLLSHASPEYSVTERGGVIETPNFRAEITNGVLTGFFNKLSQEEFLDQRATLSNVVPHIPTGFGTQNGEEAFAASATMYHMPWAEHPNTANWPNKHFPDAQSKFQGEVKDGVLHLTYQNLFNGSKRFPKDVFALQVTVDKETGDLLITPSGSSPEPGVYAANLTIAPLAKGISVEAPIFDGLRITQDMEPMLWVNTWAGYWDYAFAALNGNRAGAVGIWTQDPTFQYYKHFFYLLNEEGLSLAFGGMNVPPFEDSKETKTLTWRIQAFDNSWAQAAARFREWRAKEVQFAKRPEWNKDISFVNSSVNANKMWIDYLSAYLEGRHLNRTVSFLATVRAAAFDTRHYDNTPYKEFGEDTKAWKESGAKSMPYLQPMIMWLGGGVEPTEEDKKIIAKSSAAKTRSVFQKDPNKSLQFYDKHHLGSQEWQDWFVGCVNEYIRLGADAIYHDETYMTPIDRRGLSVNGKTSPQGLAEYFYRVQTENPNSIHASEHLNEINTVGASLGIGSGIHWGTAGSMRHQRITNVSPVSASLAYPHAAIFSFPHQSQYNYGATLKNHWGTDIMERRGEIAGRHVQSPFLTGRVVPFTAWVNELWLNRKRDTTFVDFGLRPHFPTDWDRNVRSYFLAKDGDEFRYLTTPWGSEFQQVSKDGSIKPVYGRITGVLNAVLPASSGGVFGWLIYNEKGLGGFHPSRYYVTDPAVKKPADAWLEATFNESYADYSYANENLLLVRIRPIEEKGSINGDNMVLRSTRVPLKIWVNGNPRDVTGDATKGYSLGGIRGDANIAVLFKEAPKGFENLNEVTSLRSLNEWNVDLFDPQWLTPQLSFQPVKNLNSGENIPGVSIPKALPNNWRNQIITTVAPPPGAKKGKLQVHYDGGAVEEVAWNGVPNPYLLRPAGKHVLTFSMEAGESAILTIGSRSTYSVGFSWEETSAPETPAP